MLNWQCVCGADNDSLSAPSCKNCGTSYSISLSAKNKDKNQPENKLMQSMGKLEALRKKEFIYHDLSVEEREDMYELMKIEKIILKLENAKREYKQAILKTKAFSIRSAYLGATASTAPKKRMNE